MIRSGDLRMTMRVTARPIRRTGLIARRKSRRPGPGHVAFDRTDVSRHCQLLKQQTQQRKQREKTTVAANDHQSAA